MAGERCPCPRRSCLHCGCAAARRFAGVHDLVHACTLRYMPCIDLVHAGSLACMRALGLCTRAHRRTCAHRPCARKLIGVHACFGPVHACSSAYMRASTLYTQAHWRAWVHRPMHVCSSACTRAQGSCLHAHRHTCVHKAHSRLPDADPRIYLTRARLGNDPLSCSPTLTFTRWTCRLPERCAGFRWATSMMYFDILARKRLALGRHVVAQTENLRRWMNSSRITHPRMSMNYR